MLKMMNNKLQVSGSNSYFENNSAYQGGAVYLKDAITAEIGNGATFVNNSATKTGGALYTMSDVNLTDASFVNNTAGEQGGAIYSTSNVTIAADQKDVVFSGNNAVDGGDIFMAGDAGKELNMKIGDDKSVIISSGVSGTNKYNMNVSGPGTLNLQSYIKNADMTVKDMSTLWLNNGSQIAGNNNTITLNDGTELLTINNQLDNLYICRGYIEKPSKEQEARIPEILACVKHCMWVNGYTKYARRGMDTGNVIGNAVFECWRHLPQYRTELSFYGYCKHYTKLAFLTEYVKWKKLCKFLSIEALADEI